MKTAILAILSLVTVTTAASAGDLDVKGRFESFSASGIVSSLPQSADDFSALAGQVGGVTVTVRDNLLDVDTISGSLVEVDGWRNNAGGVIGAVGFAGVRGAFERD